MPGPFTALAERILRNKAPSAETNSILGLLGGLAGGKLGGEAALHVGKRVEPNVAEILNAYHVPKHQHVDALNHMQGHEGLHGVASLAELRNGLAAENSADKRVAQEVATDALVQSEINKRLLGAQAGHEGKKHTIGNIIGGTLGAAAPAVIRDTMHQVRINRLSKKLALGTGVAATGAAGGFALYKQKQAELEKEAMSLNPFRAIGEGMASWKAARQAAGVAKGFVPAAGDAMKAVEGMPGVMEGTLAHGNAIRAGEKAFKGQGMLGGGMQRPAQEMLHQGEVSYAHPGAVIPQGARLGSVGSFTRQGGIKPGAQVREMKQQGIVPNTAVDPRAVNPTIQGPMQSPHINAQGIAQPLPGAVSHTTAAGESSLYNPKLSPGQNENASKMFNQFKNIVPPNIAEHIKGNWAEYTGLFASLLGVYGEKAAAQMAMKRMAEKAVPWAAGGLAAGAGLGMLSNHNHN